jgi:hypothetical protein
MTVDSPPVSHENRFFQLVTLKMDRVLNGNERIQVLQLGNIRRMDDDPNFIFVHILPRINKFIALVATLAIGTGLISTTVSTAPTHTTSVPSSSTSAEHPVHPGAPTNARFGREEGGAVGEVSNGSTSPYNLQRIAKPCRWSSICVSQSCRTSQHNLSTTFTGNGRE